MSTRPGLTAREILSVLTDIPDDVSEYKDEATALMKMMTSYWQQINLALLVKMRM